MSAVQVVVDTDHVDGGIVAELGSVCARAAVEVLPWRSLQTAARPVLIVGSLRRGERQIPPPLLEAINTDPRAALLLLSDDPLVRPVVATHAGRVTLLAQGASRQRIRGTLRMLLAHHGRFSRERLHARACTAVFGASSAAVPGIHHDDTGAVTAVFPFDGGWSGAEMLSAEAHQVAYVDLDEDEQRRQMRELFGSAAGMVHLTSGAREWRVYWPSSTSSLLLCSPARLPAVCNLGDPADTRVLHLAASPGDVIVGLSPGLPSGALAHRGLAVADGGAAFLDDVEASGEGRSALSGMVVEVR